MKTRQERIAIKIMPNGTIRPFDSLKKTLISEWQIQSVNAIADTILTNGNAKIWVKKSGQ